MVAVGLVVPHGIQGAEAPVKAYHMEAVCGVEGRFFLLFLSFLRRDLLHIRHNLPDEGAVAISLRIHNLPIYNTAFSKRFPDGDGVNIVKVILFLLGVEVVGLNELRNAPLHLCPRQYNRLGISHGDLQRFRGILQAVLPCQPCGGIPVAGVSLHIADNCVLAFNPAVPALQGRVDVRLRDLVGRGRNRRCQRGVKLVQKLLMEPVVERGHIEIEARELQILRRHDDAPDCRRPLQIGVLTVGIAAGVEKYFILGKRVAHAQAVSLEQLLYRGLSLLCGRVAEHPRAIRTELRFIGIDGGFGLMVNGTQGIGVPLRAVFALCGNGHVVLISQTFHIFFQPIRWNATHLHTASAGDVAGGQVHIQQLRRLFCVLAVHFEEIAHLKQDDVVRVSFLYGVVVIPCCASLCGLPLKLLKARLFLRGQETVFADQLGDTLGNVRPVQLNFRAVLFFQADALAAVILAAVGRAGYRMGASPNAVFVFQEVRLLFGAVFLFEIGVDAPLAPFNIAAAGQGRGDLVLGNEPLHGGDLRHFGAVLPAGQGQLPQALPDIVRLVVMEAQQAPVLPAVGLELHKIFQKNLTESRFRQPLGKPCRFLREAAAPHIRQAGEIALRPCLFT